MKTSPHDDDSSVGANGGQLVDELAHAIGLRISEGTIAPGTWLRQRALADEYGVSRTPVREALQKLEANQVVELVPRRGAIVIGPTAQQLKEMYVVRAELEGRAASLAARYATVQDIAMLDEQLTRAAQTDQIPPPGVDFHKAVHAVAGNSILSRVLDEVLRLAPARVAWSAVRANPRVHLEDLAQHRQVLEAIRDADEVASRTVMYDHLVWSADLAIGWFERNLEPAPVPVAARTRR